MSSSAPSADAMEEPVQAPAEPYGKLFRRFLRFGLSFDLTETGFQAAFLGVQPAVIALIVRACHRIGGHCLTDVALWIIAGLTAAGELSGLSFWVTLPLAGLAYLGVAGKRRWLAVIAALALVLCMVQFSSVGQGGAGKGATVAAGETGARQPVGPDRLFVSGLRAGLLTFGGAYTAIPFVKNDAVERGAWMTEGDFLDGLALSGILPAPLIIFSTFVGYAGGGPWGALAMTAGIFLPAFLFSILFFRHLEAVISNPTLHHFLEGVTAGVVGLIAVTTVTLGLQAIGTWTALGIFAGALAMLYLWKSKFAIPAIVLAAGIVGSVLR